jgi:hypothetical protein
MELVLPVGIEYPAPATTWQTPGKVGFTYELSNIRNYAKDAVDEFVSAGRRSNIAARQVDRWQSSE